MTLSDQRSQLRIAEDWKRIYQSFSNADFKNYDFDSLRRIMISYIKENYPEDFNDYIESSEYIALIDLVAFLGQNLAFRIDLNARENFLDLAERRESILRLARLISYNPKRNQCAHGLLKLDSVSTSEVIRSSSNINLQDQTIIWNDPTNSDWYEQFVRVLNAALPRNNQVGNPLVSDLVNGISSAQYKIYNNNGTVPVFPFRSTIKGSAINFEVVSGSIRSGTIIEDAPSPTTGFSLIYRDDGHGAGSDNTGFFCMFKQGTINEGVFSILDPTINQVVAIDTANINETDIWLYALDENNNQTELWERVDTTRSNNVVYNDSITNTRNIYSVLSRINDKISLVFSDGIFGNIPYGNYRVYYRTSRNQRISITPNTIRGVTISIPYTSSNNKTEQLLLSFSLKSPVSNGTESETNESIKQNAPAAYYTQNRLITAEDYQLGINASSQDIIKSKTVNRSASGFSRYFDMIDATGKYSNTVLFGDDGVLYKKYEYKTVPFSFSTTNDVEQLVYGIIAQELKQPELLNYYLSEYPRIDISGYNLSWNFQTYQTNQCTGFLLNSGGNRVKLGPYATGNLKYIKFNSLVKFEAPVGYVFSNGELVAEQTDSAHSRYIWSKIVNVHSDGVELVNEQGAIVLDNLIPDGARITEIISPLPIVFLDQVQEQIINLITSYKTFGLRYDRSTGAWVIVTPDNVNLIDQFSVTREGDNSNKNLDSSWLLLFRSSGNKYTMTVRSLLYVFESARNIQFYYDSAERKPTTPPDILTILDMNLGVDMDKSWKVVGEYRDDTGYVNTNKVYVSFTDTDADGTVDDPDIFSTVVPETNLVFMKAKQVYGKINDYEYHPYDETNVIVFENKNQLREPAQYNDGQLFYFIDEQVFEQYNKTTNSFSISLEYNAHVGIDNINFKYDHYSDYASRIDPSVSNIMETYILTAQYDYQFRKWLSAGVGDPPNPPTSDELHLSYSTKISQIKSISDEVIYHPVEYKVLFGPHADPAFQAIFKVVKNTNINLNDNELKADIIRSMNSYFSLDNWDFGKTFYFSELAAHVHAELYPRISSLLIIPVHQSMNFGALYEIHAKPDEIFIHDVTVDNIRIIDEITEYELHS